MGLIARLFRDESRQLADQLAQLRWRHGLARAEAQLLQQQDDQQLAAVNALFSAGQADAIKLYDILCQGLDSQDTKQLQHVIEGADLAALQLALELNSPAGENLRGWIARATPALLTQLPPSPFEKITHDRQYIQDNLLDLLAKQSDLDALSSPAPAAPTPLSGRWSGRLDKRARREIAALQQKLSKIQEQAPPTQAIATISQQLEALQQTARSYHQTNQLLRQRRATLATNLNQMDLAAIDSLLGDLTPAQRAELLSAPADGADNLLAAMLALTADTDTKLRLLEDYGALAPAAMTAPLFHLLSCADHISDQRWLKLAEILPTDQLATWLRQPIYQPVALAPDAENYIQVAFAAGVLDAVIDKLRASDLRFIGNRLAGLDGEDFQHLLLASAEEMYRAFQLPGLVEWLAATDKQGINLFTALAGNGDDMQRLRSVLAPLFTLCANREEQVYLAFQLASIANPALAPILQQLGHSLYDGVLRIAEDSIHGSKIDVVEIHSDCIQIVVDGDAVTWRMDTSHLTTKLDALAASGQLYAIPDTSLYLNFASLSEIFIKVKENAYSVHVISSGSVKKYDISEAAADALMAKIASQGDWQVFDDDLAINTRHLVAIQATDSDLDICYNQSSNSYSNCDATTLRRQWRELAWRSGFYQLDTGSLINAKLVEAAYYDQGKLCIHAHKDGKMEIAMTLEQATKWLEKLGRDVGWLAVADGCYINPARIVELCVKGNQLEIGYPDHILRHSMDNHLALAALDQLCANGSFIRLEDECALNMQRIDTVWWDDKDKQLEYSAGNKLYSQQMTRLQARETIKAIKAAAPLIEMAPLDCAKPQSLLWLWYDTAKGALRYWLPGRHDDLVKSTISDAEKTISQVLAQQHHAGTPAMAHAQELQWLLTLPHPIRAPAIAAAPAGSSSANSDLDDLWAKLEQAAAAHHQDSTGAASAAIALPSAADKPHNQLRL